MNIGNITMPLGIIADVGNDLTRFSTALGDNVYYNIIFQVVAGIQHPSLGEIRKEIEVQPLVVTPNSIDYAYMSRSKITQTPNGAWKDSFGLGLTRVTLTGEFGQAPRLMGAVMKSGYRRMIEFKERIMKWSNTRPGEVSTSYGSGRTNYNSLALQTKLGPWYGMNVIFYLNYYDFYQKEFFSVNADNMRIIQSARRNNLPAYTIALTELGPLKGLTSGEVSSNPTVVGLWEAQSMMDAAAYGLSAFEDSINNLPVLSDILTGVTLVKGVLSSVAQMIPDISKTLAGAVLGSITKPVQLGSAAATKSAVLRGV